LALKISLKPGEKFVVNGAVVTNGDRRSSLVVQNKVSILRERDIMTEDEAISSPARRVYFTIMLSYLDPDKATAYYDDFVQRMTDLMGALTCPEAQLSCVQVSLDMMNHDFYRALTGCRKLIDYETKALALLLKGTDDGAGDLPAGTEGCGIAA
jgi:flagellar biosynthesis repressor protein FlbT